MHEKENWKKKFLVIWVGQFISLMTSSAVNFAIIIWLSIEHGSAEVLAYGAIAGMLPAAVIGPFAGIYIDRWNRKKTMMFADGFVALCTLVMSISFYLGYESLLLIYAMLALRSVGSAFHMPAMQASIPMIAPERELLRIAGVNQMIQSVSAIAGPALGALAITLLSIGNVLLLDIVGAVVAIVSLLFVYIPDPVVPEKAKASFRQAQSDLRLGFRAILDNRGLTWLFTYSSIATFCIMPVAVLFPLLTLQYFGGGKLEMSIIEMVWGIGMLVGGSVLGVFKLTVRKVVMINVMHMVLGVSLSLSGVIPPYAFWLFVGLTAIGGVAATIYNASFMTVLQEEVRPEVMGRVFSLYFSIAIIPTVVGLLGTGWASDLFGVNNIFIVLGAVIALIGILSFFNPYIMALGKRDG
ncbi:DHA3 family macrolide efflux protein-like MFS transporter [Sphingobacterium allocomposti]|uniref:DHA3 family macrolide efflux protein-like MFS transporter n=1 Tax=Sphingobacterium allocomposti TaxID=415956 RepID=A0A5S5DPP3_9SPHI|nr:MFS transporter [Sphingobacterium composti Yoo et al. 2007 non Ten et al. 2007]TYP97685.1 DHA3 family macrolide efflux protein-like MFS transporter [Sphingobacterium composti Yoo et al. 2007 non Ten et al. 2007]